MHVVDFVTLFIKTNLKQELIIISLYTCNTFSCISQNMKDKEPSVSSFALFAKNFNDYKESTLQFQQRVDYIRSLYEVGLQFVFNKL